MDWWMLKDEASWCVEEWVGVEGCNDYLIGITKFGYSHVNGILYITYSF